MKKLLYLCLTVLSVGLSLGCGPKATDTSGAAPPQTPEATQQEIEKAVESGKIDPATYGKGS